MSCMSSTTMTVTSASMISDDPPYKLVFVFVCLCVYVDMCLYVVEPSGFRVLGFFRCLRRFLSINETSLSSSNRPLLSPRRRPGNTQVAPRLQGLCSYLSRYWEVSSVYRIPLNYLHQDLHVRISPGVMGCCVLVGICCKP